MGAKLAPETCLRPNLLSKLFASETYAQIYFNLVWVNLRLAHKPKPKIATLPTTGKASVSQGTAVAPTLSMARRLIAKSCGLAGAIGTLKASLDILAVLSFTPIKMAELSLFPFELPT